MQAFLIRVVADRVPDLAHCVDQGSGGQGTAVHRGLRVLEQVMDDGDLPASVGQARFQSDQMGGQNRPGLRGFCHDGPNVLQRQAHPPQMRHQASLANLGRKVEAVTGRRVDQRRQQHASAVVEAQRTDGQPAES